jgi:hypothetical protein
VLGHPGLAKAQGRHQVADRPLPAAEQIEDAPPVWLDQNLEHAKNITVQKYNCQGIEALQARSDRGAGTPGPFSRGQGPPGPKRPRPSYGARVTRAPSSGARVTPAPNDGVSRGVRLPPTSATGADVTADAASSGAPGDCGSLPRE